MLSCSGTVILKLLSTVQAKQAIAITNHYCMMLLVTHLTSHIYAQKITAFAEVCTKALEYHFDALQANGQSS